MKVKDIEDLGLIDKDKDKVLSMDTDTLVLRPDERTGIFCTYLLVKKSKVIQKLTDLLVSHSGLDYVGAYEKSIRIFTEGRDADYLSRGRYRGKKNILNVGNKEIYLYYI